MAANLTRLIQSFNMDTLQRIKRTAEMSARILRDPARVDGWVSAERLARKFDVIAKLLDVDRIARSLDWKPETGNPEFSQAGDWLYEAKFEGVRVACGCNDGGPVVWVGHATKDVWIDSIACDGSFEGGARSAVDLAIELSQRPDARELLGLPDE